MARTGGALLDGEEPETGVRVTTVGLDCLADRAKQPINEITDALLRDTAAEIRLNLTD